MKSLYEKSNSIFCTNFQAMGFSECDVLRITPSNIVYEYEIKTSRSDFKADLRKNINTVDYQILLAKTMSI